MCTPTPAALSAPSGAPSDEACEPRRPAGRHPLPESLRRLPAKYEPIRVVGTGSMGTVVLARELSLGRLVAIKSLHTDCGRLLGRLRDEARLLARLAHPAIVPVYELEVFGGCLYLAMQYLPGGNLALARLDPLPLVRTLRGVVDALAHAHANGVVHRDVKPENLLLPRAIAGPGVAGRAVLSDFGLACGLREGSPAMRRPIVGTPLTMSPEQIEGAAVGPASDVFSLGVTLYRLLAGRWPFRGRTVMDVFDAVRHGRPEPLADVGRAAGRTRVPRRLESLVHRMLAKEARERPGSMETVGRDFDRLLAGRSLFALSWPRRRTSTVTAATPYLPPHDSTDEDSDE